VTRSLLVYDDSRAAFTAAADLLAEATNLELVAWQDERVQSFLSAQFDERPFSFILIDEETVYVGADAIERLLERGDVADSLATLVKRVYPPLSAPFGRLVHGQEPADLHGSFPLTPEARAHLDSLRRTYSIPVDSG